MKLAASSWSVHRALEDGKMTQQDFILKCSREWHLDGVELLDRHFPRPTKNYLRELKRICTCEGLTISCIAVSNDFGKPTAAERRDEVDKVRKWIEAAAFLGAPVIRVFAGSAQERPEQIRPKMVENLRRCSDSGEEAGVILGLENHGGFTQKPEDLLNILREVDSKWLMHVLDTGNYGDHSYDSIEKTLPEAVHVHAKVIKLDGLDYGRIMTLLRKYKYQGFLSVEYEGKGEEVGETSRAIAMLRGHLRQ
ncbi:MAG: sugar phosphate isomerase/epimerase [Armatimonadetes bacterium]|nr:sugar phosphate isomerase/epimerase [Armatimonadota bacterium]